MPKSNATAPAGSAVHSAEDLAALPEAVRDAVGKAFEECLFQLTSQAEVLQWLSALNATIGDLIEGALSGNDHVRQHRARKLSELAAYLVDDSMGMLDLAEDVMRRDHIPAAWAAIGLMR